MRPSLLLLLAGCSGSVFDSPGAAVDPLVLTVDSPVYGQFLGDARTVEVTGHVSRADALVWVEGYGVNVGAEGGFSVEVPVDGDYRIVDVEAADQAASGETEHLRQRFPVFTGVDPMETWPGGVGVRATPELLAELGAVLEDTIDASGWESLISSAIPTFSTAALAITPLTVTHAPLDVALVPVDGAVAATISIPDFELSTELQSDTLGLDLPFTIGSDLVTIGASLVPAVDASGAITLTLASSTFELGDPILQLGAIDPTILETVLGGVDGFISTLGTGLVDLIFGFLPTLSLPALGTTIDLLGTSVTTSVADLGADPDGVFLALGLGIDGDPGQAGEIPIPASGAGDLDVAVHEGLFQTLLSSDLLSLLDQELVLPEPFSSALSLPLQNLPGGALLPAATGWCLDLHPGDARVARVTPGEDTIAKLYLPDVEVAFAYSDATHTCEPWLTTSLAVELGVVADGTSLAFDLSVPDGAVLYYGADVDFDEDDVVATLGTTLEGLLGLLGGSLSIDLSTLLGGGATGTGLLGGLAPEVNGSSALRDADGAVVPGVTVLDLELL